MTVRTKHLLAVGLVLMVLSGCAYDASKKGAYMKNYLQALAETDPQKIAPLPPGSQEEKKAIERFKEFYLVFSEEKIRKSVKDVYGQNAYFRDGFREVRGVEAIEGYFVSSTEGLAECTFDIQDVVSKEGNYYFRWIMNLTLKRDRKDRIQAVGMSHVRFDKDGKITFHQDYWDTGIIYEKVPVLGSIITWIRNRI